MTDLPSLRGERRAGVVIYRGGVAGAAVAGAVAVVAAALVPFGGWRPWLALPLVLLLAVPLIVAIRRLPAPPVPLWAATGCVGLSVSHGIWAAVTRSEHVVLRRDAGSYALYAQWIGSQHGLPVPAHLAAYGGAPALADPAFVLGSPAYYQVLHGAPAPTSAEIVPQFLVGAPAWFSIGWWTAGWNGLLIAPAIAAGLAMLAVAGLAARLIGPRSAVFAVAALAVCAPELHASRGTYSEPVALLLVAAAASLLVDAVAAGNDAAAEGDPGWIRCRRVGLAAGLAFGLAGLVRVDALREVILLLPVAAVLALRRHPAAGPLVAGALAGTAASFIWAVWMSRPYLGTVSGSLLPLVAGGVLIGVLSLAAVLIGRRRGAAAQARPQPDPQTEQQAEPQPAPRPRLLTRIMPRLAAAAMVLLGLGLASRPLWQVTRQDPNDPGSLFVGAVQAGEGLPIDPGRTYAEHSLQWVSWWLGPVSIVATWLTFIGLVAAAVRWWQRTAGGSARRDVPAWLGPAVVGLGSTVLTLYRPGITPDHPWADRRLAVEVLPTVALAATMAAAVAIRHARRRWPAALLVAVTVVAAVGLVGPAAIATAPLADARTEVGEPAAVQQLCARLGPDDVLLAVDIRAANEWSQVVRGVCRRPAAAISMNPKVLPAAGQLAAVQRITARIAAAGGRPVLIAGSLSGARLEARALIAAGRPPATALPPRVVHLRTAEDPRLLTRRPDYVVPLLVDVWLAVLPGGPGG